MSIILGRTQGLKPSQLKTLEKISKRHNSTHDIIGWDTLKLLTLLSHELGKSIGILINRKGDVSLVMIGDKKNLMLSQNPKVPYWLQGLRLIKTDFANLAMGDGEKRDLISRNLDLVAVVNMTAQGMPKMMQVMHPALENIENERVAQILAAQDASRYDFDLKDFFTQLDQKQKGKITVKVNTRKKAYIIALRIGDDRLLEDDLVELKELVRSLDIEVVDTIIQNKDKVDGKYFVGFGKIQSIVEKAPSVGVTHLLFLQNLSPNQLRHISELTECEVMDRTQVIFEIFSRRATSHDGKLQVELARLKYMLPRLRDREKNLSRLVGGIGAQGPGETSLEIYRRRAKDRIKKLEDQLEELSHKRASKRNLRKRSQVPIVAIVGYTNAGKSTLLNTLTKASALVENKPFATLDPFSKRLRFPEDKELILTDTVGFIRDLPKDLFNAFRATLEEIGEADLIIHLVDISHENYPDRIDAVHSILESLEYHTIPSLLVFNKTDLITIEESYAIVQRNEAIGISANDPRTCRRLTETMQAMLWKNQDSRLAEEE